jgi:hypothetical protein
VAGEGRNGRLSLSVHQTVWAGVLPVVRQSGQGNDVRLQILEILRESYIPELKVLAVTTLLWWLWLGNGIVKTERIRHSNAQKNLHVTQALLSQQVNLKN